MKPEDLPVKSMGAVQARDKETWLALFEDDAVVEDPVGGHPALDPEGNGQRGKEAIGKFYDLFSSSGATMNFEIHHLVGCGSEAACLVTMTSTMPDGTAHEQKLLNVYKMSPAGKIASLRSFWN